MRKGIHCTNHEYFRWWNKALNSVQFTVLVIHVQCPNEMVTHMMLWLRNKRRYCFQCSRAYLLQMRRQLYFVIYYVTFWSWCHRFSWDQILTGECVIKTTKWTNHNKTVINLFLCAWQRSTEVACMHQKHRKTWYCTKRLLSRHGCSYMVITISVNYQWR